MVHMVQVTSGRPEGSWTRTLEAKKAKEAQGKMINTAEMEETWGPSSIALPQLNCLPSLPPG